MIHHSFASCIVGSSRFVFPNVLWPYPCASATACLTEERFTPRCPRDQSKGKTRMSLFIGPFSYHSQMAQSNDRACRNIQTHRHTYTRIETVCDHEHTLMAWPTKTTHGKLIGHPSPNYHIKLFEICGYAELKHFEPSCAAAYHTHTPLVLTHQRIPTPLYSILTKMPACRYDA